MKDARVVFDGMLWILRAGARSIEVITLHLGLGWVLEYGESYRRRAFTQVSCLS